MKKQENSGGKQTEAPAANKEKKGKKTRPAKKPSSLLSKKDIKTLEGFCEGTQGYFGKMLEYLENFIENGIESGRFTEEEARADLEIALWYAYACNNLDDYEHYYMAAQWMPSSEQNAAGCGAWYYRYSCCLMYCGRLEEALGISEKGVLEDPKYPWGFLQLAKLRCHFGRKEKALEAVRQGLLLEPGDYEFLTLQREIQEGRSLEEMEFHYIDPACDQDLQNGLMDDDYFKKLSVAGIVCDKKALAQIKELFSPAGWKADCPYCSFRYWSDAQEINCVFRMNEAALSKMDLTWLAAQKRQLDEGRYPASMEWEGEEYLLSSVIFDIDCSMLLAYAGAENGRELLFKVRESENEAGLMS